MILWGGVAINGNPVATHPINSLYISLDNISPASLFGGTWECIAENVTLPLGLTAPVKIESDDQGMRYTLGNSTILANSSSNTQKNSQGNLGYFNIGEQITAGADLLKYKSGLTALANLSNSTNAIKIWIWKRIY